LYIKAQRTAVHLPCTTTSICSRTEQAQMNVLVRVIVDQKWHRHMWTTSTSSASCHRHSARFRRSAKHVTVQLMSQSQFAGTSEFHLPQFIS